MILRFACQTYIPRRRQDRETRCIHILDRFLQVGSVRAVADVAIDGLTCRDVPQGLGIIKIATQVPKICIGVFPGSNLHVRF